jgi:hypothetical protein
VGSFICLSGQPAGDGGRYGSPAAYRSARKTGNPALLHGRPERAAPGDVLGGGQGGRSASAGGDTGIDLTDRLTNEV